MAEIVAPPTLGRAVALLEAASEATAGCDGRVGCGGNRHILTRSESVSCVIGPEKELTPALGRAVALLKAANVGIAGCDGRVGCREGRRRLVVGVVGVLSPALGRAVALFEAAR